MPIRVEDIDLAELAGALQRTFAEQAPAGYVLGRTAFRDALVRQLGCSQLEAEQLVDTMIARGFLRYQGTPSAQVDARDRWLVTRQPSSTLSS